MGNGSSLVESSPAQSTSAISVTPAQSTSATSVTPAQSTSAAVTAFVLEEGTTGVLAHGDPTLAFKALGVRQKGLNEIVFGTVPVAHAKGYAKIHIVRRRILMSFLSTGSDRNTTAVCVVFSSSSDAQTSAFLSVFPEVRQVCKMGLSKGFLLSKMIQELSKLRDFCITASEANVESSKIVLVKGFEIPLTCLLAGVNRVRICESLAPLAHALEALLRPSIIGASLGFTAGPPRTLLSSRLFISPKSTPPSLPPSRCARLVGQALSLNLYQAARMILKALSLRVQMVVQFARAEWKGHCVTDLVQQVRKSLLVHPEDLSLVFLLAARDASLYPDVFEAIQMAVLLVQNA